MSNLFIKICMRVSFIIPKVIGNYQKSLQPVQLYTIECELYTIVLDYLWRYPHIIIVSTAVRSR